MTSPGWYPDPHGGSRYWDGQQWTADYVPESTSTGIPGWALVGWWVLNGLGAVACWWFVLLMVTFGCDSGWEGCETVGISVVIGYAVVAGLGITGLLIWAFAKPTVGIKVIAFLLMPCWVILSVVLAFVAYALMAGAAL